MTIRNVPDSDITVFDGKTTTFDREFTFTIKARDFSGLVETEKVFKIKVDDSNNKTFSNIYIQALTTKAKRLSWFNFITDASIFIPDNLYRYGDPNFGIQSELKMLIYAGIESTQAIKYVQAISRNHYRKRLKFGNLNVAKAKDPITQDTIYETIYVDVVDEYEYNGKNIPETIELKNDIESKVLVSYDAIKVDSDIPFVSDSDHQRIFPNSIKNMRSRIESVGDFDREFLPLWMRSIQDQESFELGYTKALVLCYCKPDASAEIINNIKNSGFDFKSIDFEIDRYIIDIIDGIIQDKYLAFPQRGEKLP